MATERDKTQRRSWEPIMHAPFDDDGVTYCGYDGIGGCGELWPCSSVRRTEGGEVISRAQYADRPGDADERKIPGNCPTCGRPFDEGDS